MSRHGGSGTEEVRRNAHADWDRWPVEDYLEENYRRLYACDAAVIRHHSAYCRPLPAGSVAEALELGCGPNLYPLMILAAASGRIDAVEPGAAGYAYLRRQLHHGPEASWQPFYDLCRRLNPALPASLSTALERVRPLHGDVSQVRQYRYGLGSMTFVAESVTEDGAEFAALCRAFLGCIRPGGGVLAAFMENMPSYRIGEGPLWPAFPVDAPAVREVFAPHTDRLVVRRVPKDPALPDYGHTGMLLLSGTRRSDADVPQLVIGSR
ncbi:class I SAM-dependent methyltransferase [Streptomyces sp. NPDC086023]|uniref:class I SAM-dependent methyltransferase n=1 Tax=Streptomyces sp. NPDC086023 TaxID=3365746 RepID=UPI0037D98FC1